MAGQIGAMALDLDSAFDQRVDVEWAVVGDGIHVVQVRPITALPTFFPHELLGEDVDLTWNLADPAWYTSMTEDERLVAPLFRDVWFLEQWERHLPPDFFPRRDGKQRDFNGYRYTSEWTWKTCGHDYESHIRWLTGHEHEIRDLWTHQTETMLRECEVITVSRQTARGAKDLIRGLLNCRDVHVDYESAHWCAPQWMYFTCQYLFGQFLEEAGVEFDVGRLLQGLPCYSVERTAAAQELGRRIEEPAVRTAFAELPLDEVIPHLLEHHPTCQFLVEFRAFGRKYGVWIPETEHDWIPGGELIPSLLTIRNTALGTARDVLEILAESAHAREQSEAELRALVSRKAPQLVPRLDKILRWSYFWVPALDDRKWSHVSWSTLIVLICETGGALVKEGLLDSLLDIFLLTANDLARIAQSDDIRAFRYLCLQRKGEYERNRRLQPPQYLGAQSESIQGDLLEVEEESTDEIRIPPGVRTLEGWGLSPGRAEGIARKVRHGEDFGVIGSVTGEEIILYPSVTTGGVDWLSLLLAARGLVTIRGVQLQHAVQISRECGIPAVNLPDTEWETIPDGARIAVDGSAGTVTILADESE